MTCKIHHHHVERHSLRRGLHMRNTDLSGLRLYQVNGSLSGRSQFCRRSLHIEIAAMVALHPLHQKISADEFVPMHAFSRLTVDRGDPHCFMHLRHMARLAGAFVAIVTVQPLQIWHLFRQRANLFSARSQRFGIESVAAAAQSRVANLRSFLRNETSGGGQHDALVAVINDERAVLGTQLVFVEARNNKMAVGSSKAVPRPVASI